MSSKAASSSMRSVQGTNDSSIVSKCSMVEKGYYSDPFLKDFVLKKVQRAPLINRGYFVRALAVNAVIEDFIRYCMSFGKNGQILSFGAGFDTLYFRIKDDRKDSTMVIVEIDFPDVIKRKQVLITSCQSLSNFIHPEDAFVNCKGSTDGSVIFDSPDYKLIGVDLAELDKFVHLLNGCSISSDLPTLLLSECSITYMDESMSNKLINWSSRYFKNALFATYEQIMPNDGFGMLMVRHFQSIGSPLRSVAKYPDMLSQRERYLTLGWEHCDVGDMNSFFQTKLSFSDRQRIDNLETFEEFEEFHLKCAHYVLICASQGIVTRGPLHNVDEAKISDLYCSSPYSLFHLVPQFGNVLRFGHRSALLGNDVIVTFGGFGVSQLGGHRRLTDVFLSDVTLSKDISIDLEKGHLKSGRLFHSLTAISDSTVLVIGGRTSPSNPCLDILSITLKNYSSSSSSDEFPSFEVKNVLPKNSKRQEARWRHTATSVVVNGKLSIVVYGGMTENQQVCGDCHLFDLSSCLWTKIDATGFRPGPRHSHAACSWDQKVVISGGLDSNSNPLNSIHILDFSRYVWDELKVPHVLPRYSHTAHTWNQKVILIGGVHTLPIPPPGIAVIDLTTGCSCEFPIPVLTQPLIIHKHSSVVVPRQEIIIILGGGGNCFSFGTHLNQCAVIVKLSELCTYFNEHKLKSTNATMNS